MAELFKFDNIDELINNPDKKFEVDKQSADYKIYKQAIANTREGLKQHVPSEELMKVQNIGVAMNKVSRVDPERTSGT